MSPAEITQSLRKGITSIENSITKPAMQLLPAGNYEALLVACEPQFVSPSKGGDYFSEEQVDLWGIHPFWGLPHYPKNEYYRVSTTTISSGGRFFEFIVPMFPSRYLRLETIDLCRELISSGAIPTALAVSILDVKQPATGALDAEFTSHWCLAHFLLDGHHKVYAASQERRPISLLSFLALDQGISSPEQVAEVLAVLSKT